MIIVLRPGVTEEQTSGLIKYIRSKAAEVEPVGGMSRSVLAVVGNSDCLDANYIAALDAVESVVRLTDPYRLAGRAMHPDDSIINVAGRKIGGGNFEMIAGPCSVESEEQVLNLAEAVKAGGAGFFRGGAYKPRTSPYDFQGLREDGLKLLSKAKAFSGLPTVSEILLPEHLPLFEDVDVIQVGARNMQNFELLKELGRVNKPILLKRGWSNTVKELLLSAEYIMSGGNDRIILCERGIRSFEPCTRNTLDLSSVCVIHEISHLPVIVDPSHATGRTKYVAPMAIAAAAAGADGLMLEVHNDPANALCDGAQAIEPAEFAEIVKKVKAVRNALT